MSEETPILAPTATRSSAAPPARGGVGAQAARAVLRAYSQVLLSGSAGVGLAVLCATLLVPSVGLVGLLGAAVSTLLAHAVGLPAAGTRRGVYAYNGLLVSLVLAAFYTPSPALVGVALVGCGVALALQLALQGLVGRLLLLPTLSLPFVAACWLVLPVLSHLPGVERRGTPAGALVELPPLPPALEGLLGAVGAVFALPHAIVGLVVLVALVAWSRVAALHALAGAAVAAATTAALIDLPVAVDPVVLGFNVVLTAVALGGVFYVPGAASLVTAVSGAALAALLTLATGQALGATGLPVLALPFNLAVLLSMLALAQRPAGSAPHPVRDPKATPEATQRAAADRARRFGRSPGPSLRLPFSGGWVCTQGHDGPTTHQGLWRHGLDFERHGPDGRAWSGAGDRVTDYHCYGQPVASMAAGVVVTVVDDLPDNPPGHVDTAHRWGNHVVVQHGPGCFAVLAHLQPRSVRVKPGDRVGTGQVLARCGSSGRAPRPHLHVQLQASPTVGAPTTPIAVVALCAGSGAGRAVRWSGVPVQGEIAANLEPAAAVARALAWPPGAALRLEVREGDAVEVQVVRSELDPLGARSLFDAESGARLSFDRRDGVALTLDVEGPLRGGLFALGLALPRVPMVGGPLRWSDALDPGRLRRDPLAPLWELARVVGPPASIPLTIEGQPEADGLRILTQGAGLRADALVSLVDGSVVATVEVGARRLELRCAPC